MNAGATPAVGEGGRLAAPLRRLAARTRDAVPADALSPCLEALRAFVDRPSPGNYLAATRCLRAAVRQQKLARLDGVGAPRRAAEHLAVIVEAAGLPSHLQRLLSTSPAGAATTRRLAVIAQLLTAHRLLSASAEATQQDLQEHLGQPAPRHFQERRRRRR